jgi:hypothetical protein
VGCADPWGDLRPYATPALTHTVSLIALSLGPDQTRARSIAEAARGPGAHASRTLPGSRSGALSACSKPTGSRLDRQRAVIVSTGTLRSRNFAIVCRLRTQPGTQAGFRGKGSPTSRAPRSPGNERVRSSSSRVETISFSAYVPELPGCVASGDSIEDFDRLIRGSHRASKRLPGAVARHPHPPRRSGCSRHQPPSAPGPRASPARRIGYLARSSCAVAVGRASSAGAPGRNRAPAMPSSEGPR